MPKKLDETHHEFRARIAGLLREVIEEADERGEPDIAELLRLALLDRGSELSAVGSLMWGGQGSQHTHIWRDLFRSLLLSLISGSCEPVHTGFPRMSLDRVGTF
jgi:hypothetical protein